MVNHCVPKKNKVRLIAYIVYIVWFACKNSKFILLTLEFQIRYNLPYCAEESQKDGGQKHPPK